MHPALLVLFGLTAAIFALTGWVLLKKRSDFPSTEQGYHHARAMRSRADWERANRTAGRLCLLSAAMLALACLLLAVCSASVGVSLLVFFPLSLAGVCLAVFLPAALLKRNR